jgi:prepilin-type N-terminal cleavage/methylation domain-containing protein
MKTRRGFTIIELLIAMALSSIVIFGLLQAYNNIMKYIKTVQEIQVVNRKICLLFNQMERDFMTAFIPPIIEKVKPEKEEPKKDESVEAKPEEKSEEEKKLNKIKNYFIAQNDDNGLAKRINDHRTYPLKNVSFINTNPLQVYGQSRTRLVRVMYELEVDKKRSKGELICYNLWRKETEDLENYRAKEDVVGFTTKSKFTQIRKHLIADGISDFFIQYFYKGEKKNEKEKNEQNKIEKKVLDTWGDTKETSGVVPNKVMVYASFWDEQLSKKVSFQATFPVMSFSLTKDKNGTAKPAAQTPPTTTPPTTPPKPHGGKP